MECGKCDREAVAHAAYAGTHLCGDHLVRSVEKRVRRRIREDGLLPADASPDNPVIWVVGLSGGKDSVVLSTDTDAYQAQVERQDYYKERMNGLWGISILSGLAGVFVIGLAYLPTRG